MPTKHLEKWIVLADGEHASEPIAAKADAEQQVAHRAETNAAAIAGALVAQGEHEARRRALVDAGHADLADKLGTGPEVPARVVFKARKVRVQVGFRVRSSRDGEVVSGPFLDSDVAETERARLDSEQRCRVDELRDPSTGEPLTDPQGSQLRWAPDAAIARLEVGLPCRPNTYWVDEIEMPLEPVAVPDPRELHDNPDAFGPGGLPAPAVEA